MNLKLEELTGEEGGAAEETAPLEEAEEEEEEEEGGGGGNWLYSLSIKSNNSMIEELIILYLSLFSRNISIRGSNRCLCMI